MANTLVVEVLVTFEIPATQETAEEEEAAVQECMERVLVTAGYQDVQEPIVVLHDLYLWENDDDASAGKA